MPKSSHKTTKSQLHCGRNQYKTKKKNSKSQNRTRYFAFTISNLHLLVEFATCYYMLKKTNTSIGYMSFVINLCNFAVQSIIILEYNYYGEI